MIINDNDVEFLPFKLGGLLYSPALNANLVLTKVLAGEYKYLHSLAFCLEDAVMDDSWIGAQEHLLQSLNCFNLRIKDADNFPLLFIRVRNPLHLQSLYDKLGNLSDLITGFILPKFDLNNLDDYIDITIKINKNSKKNIYFMPILESEQIANCITRKATLQQLKEGLNLISEYILNIRVGGTDFCNLYGVRRNITQTIYDIGVVRDILIDIVNIFSNKYTISAPICEYFGSQADMPWQKILQKELELDKLNGFIGKSCIHPSQLEIVNKSNMVSVNDFEDAKNILNWQSKQGVEKGSCGSRMNELKCHYKWAKKTFILAAIYGVTKEQCI